jgi:hypothetical protein
MAFLYRGYQYQTTQLPLRRSNIIFPCKYRGIAYQSQLVYPVIPETSQKVNLKYRGIPYIR